jgi:hypothetical protein
MALLGEEVVEEWLNRQGYFTIRGIELGVHEIDILAFRPRTDGPHEYRHIEVQISTNPIAYISKVPKKIQKERGIGPDNAKTRSIDELTLGVQEWIQKKFDHPKKQTLRKRLWAASWTRELVVNAVKHREELSIFQQFGISVIQLEDIVREMITMQAVISSAAGNDLVTLMHLGAKGGIPTKAPVELLKALQEEAEEEVVESSDNSPQRGGSQ